MDKQKLKQCCLDESASLSEILTVLNAGVFGIALMVDQRGSLVGVFTDGDVRRAVMDGCTLQDDVKEHMNRDFTFAREADGHLAALALLGENKRHIPILDEQGRPVDMVSLTEIWKLSVAAPDLAGNEIKYVADCLATGWISSRGKYVHEFESKLSEYFFSPEPSAGQAEAGTLAVANGTCALQLAIAALQLGPGDEILVPNLTFGATANAVLHAGATPVYVDVEPDYWCIDPEAMKAAISPRTKAVIPVHIYGHPADMDAIMTIAKDHNLYVIEDCAEAIGAQVNGRQVGTIGDIGCFSFFANKIITTGEGGAVTSKDPDLLKRMQLLMSHGMDPTRRYWHLMPGFNFRMTNMQAAIGLAQMERIDDFLARRAHLAARYSKGLGDLDWIILPQKAPWADRVEWLYSIRLADHAPMTRDQLSAQLGSLNIETRDIFPPLNIQPAFGRTKEEQFPNASAIARTGLSLPTSVDMSDQMIDHVIASIRQIEEKRAVSKDMDKG